MQNLDGFYIDQQTIVHEKVKTQRLIEDKPLVFHANQFLRRCWNRAQFQLAQQASLVDRLNQSRTLVPVNFDCRTNDFPAKLVRLVVKWMHRKDSKQKVTKETKILFCPNLENPH